MREGSAIKKYSQTALRLSLLYILFAGLYIVFSDGLLAFLVEDSLMLTQIQTSKGSIFVIVTGMLAFFALNREFKVRQHVEEELSSHRDKLAELIEAQTAELHSANEQLYLISKAVEEASDAVGITDIEKKLVYQNKAYDSMFGYNGAELNAKGGTSKLFTNPELARELFTAIVQGDSWNGEVDLCTKSGTIVSAYLSADAIKDEQGKIIALLTIFKDLTERKRLDKEIARLEHLHLIGEMAAGIGHEIRNPMTSVRGFLQILKDKPACAKYNDYFDVMIDELDRANSIITDYLSLAKNKKAVLKPHNLNQLIQEIMPLLSIDAEVLGQKVTVEGGEIPELLLDSKEIRQLLINLVRNGLEAMAPGGHLQLKTYIANQQVVLAIKDQGTGIMSDILDKLGTPFFTTKDFGTGLGLAICYSIAARHNATIKIDTSENGTTFFVLFELPNNV